MESKLLFSSVTVSISTLGLKITSLLKLESVVNKEAN